VLLSFEEESEKRKGTELLGITVSVLVSEMNYFIKYKKKKKINTKIKIMRN
jgi:hypothetical protein